MFKFFPAQNSVFRDRTMVRSTPAIRTQITAPCSTASAQNKAGRWWGEQQTDWKPVLLFLHVCLGPLSEEGPISIGPFQNKTVTGASHKGDKKNRNGEQQTPPVQCPTQPRPAAFSHTSAPQPRVVALCLHGCRLPDGTDFLLASFHSPS